MINTVLTQLQKYLRFRFLQCGNDWKVELSSLPKDKQLSTNGIVLTLWRIEEETTHKQQISYRKEASRTYKVNPDVCINLYVLVSSHTQDYNMALHRISETMRILNTDMNPLTNPSALVSKTYKVKDEDKEAAGFVETLSIELQNQTEEQYNSMWQTLGHVVVPCALYKIRMVKLEAPTPYESGHVIGINDRGEQVPDPVDIRIAGGGVPLSEVRSDYQEDLEARLKAERK